jgi:hypothetical protein
MYNIPKELMTLKPECKDCFFRRGPACTGSFENLKISQDYGGLRKCKETDEYLKQFLAEELGRLGDIKNKYVVIMAQVEDRCFYAEALDTQQQVEENILTSMAEDEFNNHQYWIFYNGKELEWEEEYHIIIK